MTRTRRTLTALAGAALVAGLTTTTALPASAAGTRPGFQVPFICGQTWVGSTYTYHNPKLSIDFNHYSSTGARDDFGRRVVASAAGTVDQVVDGPDASYGNYIVIRHGNGWKTRYAHLKEDSMVVTKGQHVNKGQVIGRVGKSGVSSAHLHYEQIRDGAVVKAVFYKDNPALYYGKRNYKSPRCD
jgi:hypothetical protein